MTVEERAWKYVETMDPAVSGQHGHIATFKVACTLVNDFALEKATAMKIIQWYNDHKCEPKWPQHALEHKIDDALKNRDGRYGQKVRGKQLPYTSRMNTTPYSGVQGRERDGDAGDSMTTLSDPKTSGVCPGVNVGEQIEESIARKRYSVKWPWPSLDRLTQALLPGAITILSAPPGTSKSLFLLEAMFYWLRNQIPFATLMLEEDQTYHVRRALAQLACNVNMLNEDWCAENPDKARQTYEDHIETMNEFGRHIYEVEDAVDGQIIAQWVRDMCIKNIRVIAVDPISAKIPRANIWIDDHNAMMKLKAHLKKSGSSLILITHPPKMRPGINPTADGSFGIGGGAAFEKFAQTALYLRGMRDDEEVEIRNADGSSTRETVNRKLEIRKARNGRGGGFSIGLHFDPQTATHVERGVIVD